MFAAIRRYEVGRGRSGEVASRASRDFVPVVSGVPGFREYFLVDDGTGVLNAVSVFESREGAEEANRRASSWDREGLAGLVRTEPEIVVGEVTVETVPGVPGPPAGRAAPDSGRLVVIALEAFNQRDLDRGAAVFARDAEIVLVPTGETFRGPEGWRQIMQRWLRAFPDGRVEVRQVVAGPDGAALEYVGQGTQTGPLATPDGDIPPGHGRVRLNFCDVCRVRDGKITSLHTYYDAGTMLRQTGTAPRARA